MEGKGFVKPELQGITEYAVRARQEVLMMSCGVSPKSDRFCSPYKWPAGHAVSMAGATVLPVKSQQIIKK